MKVILNCSVMDDKGVHSPGSTVDLPDDQAGVLISRGMASPAEADAPATDESAKVPPDPVKTIAPMKPPDGGAESKDGAEKK